MDTRRDFLKLSLGCIALNDDDSGTNGWRYLFIEINREFVRILPGAQIVNCGKKPNDGTGDTVTDALGKIRDNLRKLCPSK